MTESTAFKRRLTLAFLVDDIRHGDFLSRVQGRSSESGLYRALNVKDSDTHHSSPPQQTVLALNAPNISGIEGKDKPLGSSEQRGRILETKSSYIPSWWLCTYQSQSISLLHLSFKGGLVAAHRQHGGCTSADDEPGFGIFWHHKR